MPTFNYTKVYTTANEEFVRYSSTTEYDLPNTATADSNAIAAVASVDALGVKTPGGLNYTGGTTITDNTTRQQITSKPMADQTNGGLS